METFLKSRMKNRRISVKFSIVISVPEMERLSLFEEKVRKVSELGYEGIELAVTDPGKINQEKLVEIISAYGLDVSCVLTGGAFTSDRLTLSHPDSKVRSLTIGRINDYISFASLFPAIVLIGWIRGIWKDDFELSRKLFVEALRKCGKFAEDKRILLGIEPINRYEVDSIHTIHEAVMTVKEAALPNLGVIPDTFHMNIEENEPIYKSIYLCRNKLFHVHVADNNRRAPGMGCLPFKKFFKALREIEYQGFVSAEVIPLLPDFETIAKESIKFLRKVA